MSSRYNDLRAARRSLDPEHVELELLAGSVALELGLLNRRQNRFGAAKVNYDVARLDTLDSRGQHLASPVYKLVKYEVALGLSEPLHDHLLGSLRCDTPRVVLQLTGDDVVAYLCALLKVLGRFDGDLGELVFDILRLNNVSDRVDGDLTVFRVDIDDYILAFSGWISLVGRRECSLDR